MSHAANGCIYTGLEKKYSIEDLAAFHGHLGPYIVLGYRIGKYVQQNFCRDPFQMNAAIFCEGVPPQSCLADGIQIGSGCTLGKRNIDIVVADEIRCEFTSGKRKMVVKPRQIRFPPQGGEDYSQLIEALAVEMYGMLDDELFAAEII